MPATETLTEPATEAPQAPPTNDLMIEVDGKLVPNYAATIKPFEEGEVVSGEVVRIDKDEVLVDIGYKSEGVIPSHELSIRRSVDPVQKRAPAGFSVPQAAQFMPLSLRHHPGLAVGVSDLCQKGLVHQRESAAIHVDQRAGIRRIPEGTQLAIEVVARAYAAQPLELVGVHVTPGALRRAGQFPARDCHPHHPLEHAEEPLLALQVERSLARALGISGTALTQLATASRFRDLGMTAVPDEIITKSEPLTDEEWDVVHAHPERSAEMLGPSPLFSDVRAIVRATHEHFDGSGYPHGLSGDEIPLGARIVLVAETYLALRAMGDTDTIAHLRERAGTLFDPAVVEALASILGQATLRAWQAR